MAREKSPLPAKLVCGILYIDEKILQECLEEVQKKFGEIDYLSDAIIFDHTDYYIEEMGKNILRRFASFRNLIDPGLLSYIKIFTNRLEEKFLRNNNRMINLDPGYLTEAKFILASAKNFQHRIYLGDGIFAEQELRWQRGEWNPFEWTYPDYRTNEYKKIFKDIRIIFREQIREHKK